MASTVSVNYVTLLAAHHGSHSGYAQIFRYFGRRVPTPALQRWPPGRLPAMLNTVCALVSGSPWYTFSALLLEFSTAIDMALRTRGIYHLLNGDTDCRYIPLLNGLRGHKVIATYHQPPSELCKGVSANTLRRLTAALAVASNQVDYLARIVGPKRVFLVPHGVDTVYFQPNEQLRTCSNLVVSVGTHLRDFDTLAHAISIVSQQHPGAHFVIVGHASRTRRLAELPRVEVYLGIPDHKLLQLYQQATLAVFSLQDCTANNAILEAMACGLPIVVTDVGGIRDYVDEQCAILTPPRNAEAVAGAILQLCADSARRQRLGKRARERALQLDFQKVVEQLRYIYESIATI